MQKNELTNTTKKELPENLTIMKRNNIIRTVINNKKELSTNSLKIYNFIYLQFQYHRKEIQESGEFSINFKHTLLKNTLQINTESYYSIVENALDQLMDTTVTIKNFTNDKGDLVLKHNTKLITHWDDHINKSDNKTKVYNIGINKTLFLEMIKQSKGFTELDMINISSLSSGNHIRLYEFVKSYQNMKKMPWHTQEELNDLFMTDLKHLSKLEEILNRAIKAINKKTDIDITYEKDKKNKKIQFTATRKTKKTNEEINKQKYAIKENIKDKEIIESLLLK